MNAKWLEKNKERFPKHIGFIMDGNGRWAKLRGKLRTYGHKIGVDSLVDISKYARKLGIKYVTFYAFSTENWKRPKDEVDEIFRLAKKCIDDNKDDFNKNNIRLNFVGNIDKLPNDLKIAIKNCIKDTKNNDGFVITIAINYGARAEIISAINKIIKAGIKSVDEKTFEKYLQTAGIPDPDFVIRTSGEYRLSNFLLYQSAYSELYFPKKYWPDFREKALDKAIKVYLKRNRRYGNV